MRFKALLTVVTARYCFKQGDGMGFEALGRENASLTTTE
jgi:hypothetical protein